MTALAVGIACLLVVNTARAEPEIIPSKTRFSMYLSPAGITAPSKFRPRYHWGAGLGGWFKARNNETALLRGGAYIDHTVGWRDANIVRTGLEGLVGAGGGRLGGYLDGRIGYAGILIGGHYPGLDLGVGLGGDVMLLWWLFLGVRGGVDFFLGGPKTSFDIYPIWTGRLHLGFRFGD